MDEKIKNEIEYLEKDRIPELKRQLKTAEEALVYSKRFLLKDGKKTEITIGVIKQTTDACPISGIWQSVDSRKCSFFFKKDELLPYFERKMINWVLIETDISVGE